MPDRIPVLEPLSPEARESMGRDRLELDRLPFRVGRESRLGIVKGALKVLERRKLKAPPNNDLYLIDERSVLNISREHFQIEQNGSGGYELVDRGSACGISVGNQRIGGDDRGGHCPLEDGNVVVVGMPDSPYVFKFRLVPKD